MEYKSQYEKLLKSMGIEFPHKLEELESVFLEARRQFVDYKLSIDQFSGICEELLAIAHKDKDLMITHLATVLLAGAELAWYIRQRPNDESKQLYYFLQSLHDYKKESA